MPNYPLSFSELEVRIDANVDQDSSVLLDGGILIRSLTVDAGDALSIASGADLLTDSVVNSGTINVASNNFSAAGLRNVGLVSNLPGSRISLDRGNLAELTPSDSLLWNQSVVEGNGWIQISTIWNEQLIDANVAGATLSIRPSLLFSSTSFINSGNLRASNGGTLRFFQWSSGPIQNYDNGVLGTIEALGDSTVSIKGGGGGVPEKTTIIYGGRIATSTVGGIEEGKVLLTDRISLVGVELDAMVYPGLTGIQLVDSTFANRKTIFMDNSSLSLEGTTIISGGGRIELSGNATLAHSSIDTSGKVSKFVNVDNTISARPFADAHVNVGLFENHGTIESNGTDASLSIGIGGLGFIFEGTEELTNQGIIRAVNGGSISIEGITTQTVVYEDVMANSGGVVEVDENSTLNIEYVRVRGGVVRGPASTPNSNSGFSGYDAKLEDVRLEGTVQWNDDGLTLYGEIENTGTLINNQVLYFGNSEVTLPAEAN